jgi:hypothetical protein
LIPVREIVFAGLQNEFSLLPVIVFPPKGSNVILAGKGSKPVKRQNLTTFKKI